jgi:hypothetical protein
MPRVPWPMHCPYIVSLPPERYLSSPPPPGPLPYVPAFFRPTSPARSAPHALFTLVEWPTKLTRLTQPQLNLFGRFEFTQSRPHVDLDALTERYNDPDFWSQALRQEVMEGQRC